MNHTLGPLASTMEDRLKMFKSVWAQHLLKEITMRGLSADDIMDLKEHFIEYVGARTSELMYYAILCKREGKFFDQDDDEVMLPDDLYKIFKRVISNDPNMIILTKLTDYF